MACMPFLDSPSDLNLSFKMDLAFRIVLERKKTLVFSGCNTLRREDLLKLPRLGHFDEDQWLKMYGYIFMFSTTSTKRNNF